MFFLLSHMEINSKKKRFCKWTQNRENKKWQQTGDRQCVREQVGSPFRFAVPSSSCVLNDTVVIVCNGFCQWHMRAGFSCPWLFSTWPNISSLNGCCQRCSWVLYSTCSLALKCEFLSMLDNMCVLIPNGHVNKIRQCPLRLAAPLFL